MLTLDDEYRLEDFGFKAYMEHDHEATPEIRRNTIPIPGMPGSWNFGSEIGERHFNIPLKVTDHDRITLQHKQNAFVAFLFDEFGKPRPIKMTFDYEPDKHYVVELSSSISPNNAIHFFRTMGLPLVASNPYRYSNVHADEVTWGSTDITFESDYLFGHTNDFAGSPIKVTRPQTLNITNSGLVVTPIIEIDGTANNLTLSSNGHSFTLPNFSNTKWVIDFEKYVVFRNGQDTMIQIRDFKLLQGNNSISVNGNNINIR